MWEVVRCLPHGKELDPDSFTEFLQCCWGIVKDDVMEAFGQLSDLNGRRFQGLNQALLILLPKRLDGLMLKPIGPLV